MLCIDLGIRTARISSHMGEVERGRSMSTAIDQELSVRDTTNIPVVTTKQDIAAINRANGMSMEDIAALVGVHVQTVKTWNQQPAFLHQVRYYRREIAERSLCLIASHQVEAILTLAHLMKHSRMDPVRLGAARAILENTRAMQEQQDLLGEIEELKRLLTTRNVSVI